MAYVVHVDPQHYVISLLQALGEIGCTLNASDAGTERWWMASYDLRKVLTSTASIARHLDIAPYEDATWPDGTRIGGDGAYAEGHRPHHLFAELVEAAGWVAEIILDRVTFTAPRATTAQHGEAREWLVVVPVTEVVAHLVSCRPVGDPGTAPQVDQRTVGVRHRRSAMYGLGPSGLTKR